MKKTINLFKLIATACLLSFALLTPTSCGSLDQWATGLQAFNEGMASASSRGTYKSVNRQSAPSNVRSTTVSPSSVTPTRVKASAPQKIWHECTGCQFSSAGKGTCKYCNGTRKG